MTKIIEKDCTYHPQIDLIAEYRELGNQLLGACFQMGRSKIKIEETSGLDVLFNRENPHIRNICIYVNKCLAVYISPEYGINSLECQVYDSRIYDHVLLIVKAFAEKLSMQEIKMCKNWMEDKNET